MIQSYVLKDLIIASKDGEWGKGEPFENSILMSVVRGTDFEDVRSGILYNLPRRHIAQRIADYKTIYGDFLILETAGGSPKRPTGRSLYIKQSIVEKSELSLVCASFARFIEINDAIADPKYIFWYLQYMYHHGLILQYNTQHTGVARFQWTVFAENEPFHLPPLPIQQKIADILSAYDDLIENNTRRIQILEEMAKTIYFEWFVNFRFPGCEDAEFENGIPAGWETKSLGDVFNIKYGKILPKVKMFESGEYPVYGAGGIIGFYNEPIRKKKVVLVTCRGAGSGNVWRTRESAYITNNNLIISPNENNNSITFHFTEQALKLMNLNGVITGSAQPQITINNLSFIDFNVPTNRILQLFTKYTKSFSVLIDNLYYKNENLRKTRDLLLPRLISGELDVSEVEVEGR